MTNNNTSMESATFAYRNPEGVESSSFLASGPSLITESGTPTDEQFEAIRSRFGDPRANVKPDDYYVFRMIASGDGLDSYFTRQDTATSFPNFVRDLKHGQSLMGNHAMGTFAYGSSYDGEVTPADEDRAEYEATFYPQWDKPDLRTKNWLVGDYFIGRGVQVNGQDTDALIRGIELGNQRKASISFMVGQYTCGIDGRDLVPSMFGPMPDEECNHFPGISYEGNIGWALMKHNTMVETSLVYKNASPSSMLLRKAENLATRGVLSSKDIDKIEARFEVRLPRFQRTVWVPAPLGEATTTVSQSAGTQYITNSQTGFVETTDARFDAQVQEDTDMASRPKGDAATRELVREALTAEPEPEQTDAVEGEAPEGAADETEVVTAEVAENADTDAATETPEEVVSEEAAPPDPEPETAPEPADNADNAGDEPAAPATESADADAETADEDARTTEAAEDRATEDSESAVRDADSEAEEVQSDAEGTREEEAVRAFVNAADRLAEAITRNPDAFDTGLLAMAARAEKTVDLALIDADCDVTVGSQVARQYEIRSRKMSEALGEPMTVEAIRSLTDKAKLGDELFAELVRDAVAARIGVQGDSFNATRYSDVLLSTRDVTYVKDEISSWKEQKKERFTPGRSVVPRQPVDTKETAQERKTLPTAPASLVPGKRQAEAASSSLIQPRSKNK